MHVLARLGFAIMETIGTMHESWWWLGLYSKIDFNYSYALTSLEVEDEDDLAAARRLKAKSLTLTRTCLDTTCRPYSRKCQSQYDSY
jgi:hypothetical protein